MKTIAELEPRQVWSVFSDILTIARPSKHEEKIREWLLTFAAKHDLQAREDAKGNVVIYKSASVGYESFDAIVLQSHMDMVCEKDSDSSHDFMTDPIDAYVDEDGWVKAHGTTLGADCGIGMAYALAVLADQTLRHPAIEALFTVDEEQGLTGAMGLGVDLLSGKSLINLDSEDEGEIFIGCAGGVDTQVTFHVTYEPAPTGFTAFQVSVGGLLGGHSGDDIHRGRACANKLLTRIVRIMTVDNKGCLATIDGGNLRNAIARNATATVLIPTDNMERIIATVTAQIQGIKAEYAIVEPDLAIVITQGNNVPNVLSAKDARRLILSLQAVPHGVIAMSQTMPGMVETSTNLASIKVQDSKIVVTTSQRSSVESAKYDIAHTVASVFRLADAEVVHSDGYPGWTPNPDAKLVKRATQTYQTLFGREPKVKVIHAGLECGLILQKYPHMEAISVGPTLRGVHSPSERIEIATVDMMWRYLCCLLAEKE